MIETPLNKVLNTMRQYVENIYEHDSEPMLNWKDIKLVLDEIERLNNIINKLDNLIEQYSKNEYYYKYNGKYLKSEIINDLKELKEGK